MVGVVVSALGVFAGRAAGQTAGAPETIDRALAKHASEISRDLRAHSYRNVGVLKFRIKKGEGPVSDRVGILNRSLADRLEIALILTNDVRDPIGIIHDASTVAAEVPGANPLEPAGRHALFEAKYPLAWGRARVSADAFLTGVVLLPADLKTMTVSIEAFDTRENVLREVTRFSASTDLPALVEAGESMIVRGGGDDDEIRQSGRASQAPTEHPLHDPSAPVALDVFYDGVRVPIDFRQDPPRVPEPQEGQKIEFEVFKRRQDEMRYGVVLFINGENSIKHQRKAARECMKWLLAPGASQMRIRGYQTGKKEAEAFRVLSAAESRSQAGRYGHDVGMVTLVVFRELGLAADGRARPEGGPPIDPLEENAAAISLSSFPEATPANPAALAIQMRALFSASNDRGTIVPGDSITAPAREVTVSFERKPAMFATIRYYKP
jgi:hypothetical protein